MSQDQIKDFIALAETSKDLQKALSEEGANVIEIAQANGFTFSAAELMRYQAEATLQLSDAELEQASGGLTPTSVAFTIGLIGTVMGVGAPVAAVTLNVCK
jgi:predicted ribosomally synthesized peptide with nif11-like leader